jgi:hypothetical protein
MSHNALRQLITFLVSAATLGCSEGHQNVQSFASDSTTVATSVRPTQQAGHERPASEAVAHSPAFDLVGTWRADVYEFGESGTFWFTMNETGSSRYAGAASGNGTWRYSDGILFERFPDGGSGKSRIRWIDEKHFELTILDNGIPAYTGLKRQYYRH